MGQKVNPVGFRIGVTHAWGSRWFAKKRNFGAYLVEDQKIRETVKQKLAEAGISKIFIERFANRVRVTLFSARPGVIIGRKGGDVEAIRAELEKMTKKEVYLEIKEVRDADADAQLVAESIAQQLERRIALKRALKRAQKVAMDMGVDGIKIHASGRINGAEIARVEWGREGKVPLHTLRANIDYGFAEANTTAGKIGIKVWICKREDFQATRRPEGRRGDRGDREGGKRHAAHA
jgi:small subunit ribosomal protein S3